MEHTPTSMVRFFKDSYAIAKQQIQENIDAFRDDLRFLALPINNFLKDITQMEEEFRETPNVVSISEAISTSTTMEENY